MGLETSVVTSSYACNVAAVDGAVIDPSPSPAYLPYFLTYVLT